MANLPYHLPILSWYGSSNPPASVVMMTWQIIYLSLCGGLDLSQIICLFSSWYGRSSWGGSVDPLDLSHLICLLSSSSGRWSAVSSSSARSSARRSTGFFWPNVLLFRRNIWLFWRNIGLFWRSTDFFWRHTGLIWWIVHNDIGPFRQKILNDVRVFWQTIDLNLLYVFKRALYILKRALYKSLVHSQKSPLSTGGVERA